jgi:ABC-type polysaccharide/polyol phosphate export permease
MAPETGMSTSVPSTSSKLRPLVTSAAEDLLRGFLKFDVWSRIGWLDVKRRYQRTTIGPFWTSLSLATYVVSVGLVGSGLWSQSIADYLPYLVSGMIVWTLLSTSVIESCSMLISGSNLIRNMRFEYSLLAYALVWRNLVVFAHNLLVYVVICAILKPSLFAPTLLLAVPGVALVVATVTWISFLCGIICLRYRDVQQLVASVIQITMLVTPIFWAPDFLQGSTRAVFVDLNPLYHLVEIVRAPLLSQFPPLTSYAVVLAMTIGGWTAAYLFYRTYRRRIAYWT